jgi:hypothetical protein
MMRLLKRFYPTAKLVDITGSSAQEIDNFSFDIWMDRVHPEDQQETQRVLQEHLLWISSRSKDLNGSHSQL